MIGSDDSRPAAKLPSVDAAAAAAAVSVPAAAAVGTTEPVQTRPFPQKRGTRGIRIRATTQLMTASATADGSVRLA